MANYSTYTNIANATTWTAGEIIIRAGNTIAWYDFTDASTLTDDGGGKISIWKDKLLSGHDLAAAGTARPTLGAAGVVFGGGTTYMKAAAFVFGQPATIYFCGKHTAHEANFRFFDGHVVDKSNLHQFNPSPNLALSYDNNVTDKLVLDTFGIVRCVFDGASSYIQVNNEAGDGGSTGAASFDGFTVGARYDGAGGNCAIVVKEIICRTVHDSAGDQTAIINYLNAKYTIY